MVLDEKYDFGELDLELLVEQGGAASTEQGGDTGAGGAEKC